MFAPVDPTLDYLFGYRSCFGLLDTDKELYNGVIYTPLLHLTVT